MKSLLVLFAVCLTALSLCAGEPSAAVKEAVLKAEAEWKTAVLKGDVPELNRLLADDLIYTHSSARTQTKKDFIQDVTSGGTTYQAIDFENTKLRQYGQVIVVTQGAVIKTVQTGTAHVYLTEVWAHEDGRWQMASRQATKIP